MNKNLFVKEFKRNLVSLAAWSLIICVLIVFTMSFYHTFTENKKQIQGLFQFLPTAILQFKGIKNVEDVFSILGYYSANNIIYMLLLGSIYSIVLSCNILLKEEYNKTAEYLLTKPVTRVEIIMTKLLIVIVNVILLNIITSLAGYLSMNAVKTSPFDVGSFMVLSAYTLLLNMLFAALGLFLSVMVRRAKPVTTLSIGIVLICYFLYNISKLTESAKLLGYLSPFSYVKVDALDKGFGLDFWHLVYFLGLPAVLVTVSVMMYKRKDIYL
jgi:ABC-2 type transport system permease protein